MKPYGEELEQKIMFAEKSRGNFEVIDIEDSGMNIKVTLQSGQHMNYHSHQNRAEVWTVIHGKGYVILDDNKKEVKPGDVIQVPEGCKHTIGAYTELKVIEVQIGKEITVYNKLKYAMPKEN